MTPVVTKLGRSFKGAFAYYLNDKRGPDSDGTTAARVAWTETLNLRSTDVKNAARIMAGTATAQVDLKKAAGAKATGRKLERPVYAYSLSWHPDERPTREEQLEAARATLALQGLEEHQAVILAHTDTHHAHVHIVVNRVHPTTGLAARHGNSKLALSRWAQAYEKGRGRIFCKERVENNARRDKRMSAPDPRTARPVFEFDRATGNDNLGTAMAAAVEKQQDAHLYAMDRAQRASHARQWRTQERLYDEAVRMLHAGGTPYPAAMAGLRSEFLSRCDQLRATQARQREEQRAAWRRRSDERHASRARHNGLNARYAAKATRRRRIVPAVDPAVIIASLTEQASTFTRADLVRHLWKHYPPDVLRQAVAAVLASDELVHVGADPGDRERYSARDLHALEHQMIANARAMHKARRQAVPPALLARALRASPITLSAEQGAALRHVTGAEDLAAVVGFAGAGKSTLFSVARAAFEAQGYRMRGAALSGVAADSLAHGAGIESQTLHSLLYALDKGRDRLTDRDVLVLDEAGMIGSRLMARLLHHARAAGAKVILVGDPEQLQAIEAGAAFRAIVERCGAARMTEVRRQREAWQRAATAALATAQTADALDRYEREGMVHGHATHADAMKALIGRWNEARRAAPHQSQIILAYTRADVRALNDRARAIRRAAHEIGVGQHVQTAHGEREFAPGDRIYFLKNDRDLNVRNGSLGTVERIAGDYLTVRLDDGRTLAIDVTLYPHLDHGYAATVHKSQGVTVDRAHLLASRYMDRHAAYVGMTRHRERLDVHWAVDEIPDRESLARIFGRDRSKDTSTDYEPRPG